MNKKYLEKLKSINMEGVKGDLTIYFKKLRVIFSLDELLDIFEVSQTTFYKFNKGIKNNDLNSKIMSRTLFELYVISGKSFETNHD